MFKKYVIIIASLVILSGCSAGRTAIVKRKLEVKTKMSETIFLDPVSADKQIVYVKVRNTSGTSDLDIEAPIKAALINRGYQVVNDPAQASFILQANVLQAGKLEDDEAMLKNFGDAIVPGVLGGAIGANAGDDTGMVIGAVTGAAIGMVGSSFIQDVTYSIITDLQISQKSGISPVSSKVKTAGATGWKKYSTRVISYANKVNLDYKEAEPVLVKELVHSVAGVL